MPASTLTIATTLSERWPSTDMPSAAALLCSYSHINNLCAVHMHAHDRRTCAQWMRGSLTAVPVW